MKTTLCCLCLISIPLNADADTIGGRWHQVKQQLNMDYEKQTGIVRARDALKSQMDHINAAADAYQKDKDRIVREMNDLNAEIARTNRDADAHNKHRCTFTLTNPDNCAAFDAETMRIGRAHAAARKREQPIDAEKNALDTTREGITSDTDAWNAAARQNDTDYNDNENEIQGLKAALEKLKQEYQACIRRQRKDRPEAMLALCGAPLDGEITDPGPGGER